MSERKITISSRREDKAVFLNAQLDRMNAELANKQLWAKQPTAKLLCQRAKDGGAWLFDPIDREWYSPEEFEDVFAKMFAGNPMFHRMQFRDPREGIEAGFIQLDRDEEKLKKLVEKVINYYRNDPAPLTPGA